MSLKKKKTKAPPELSLSWKEGKGHNLPCCWKVEWNFTIPYLEWMIILWFFLNVFFFKQTATFSSNQNKGYQHYKKKVSMFDKNNARPCIVQELNAVLWFCLVNQRNMTPYTRKAQRTHMYILLLNWVYCFGKSCL